MQSFHHSDKTHSSVSSDPARFLFREHVFYTVLFVILIQISLQTWAKSIFYCALIIHKLQELFDNYIKLQVGVHQFKPVR